MLIMLGRQTTVGVPTAELISPTLFGFLDLCIAHYISFLMPRFLASVKDDGLLTQAGRDTKE
jgi:hypothetical protein